MRSNPFHVIKDPVHGTMQFTSMEDAWVKPFIDSPHFQRLRHIKQLGLGDLIFPGAMHSRFNHSLGCCYVGSQIAEKIGLPDEERQLVMIACLLHDMGHGPFSHAFEGIFEDKMIRHERWTPYFLKDYSTSQFFKLYNAQNPRHPLNEEKFKVIADMIMHREVGKPVLADIVSSQLDADRLDYLLRDSHFCGVQYGEFDFRWMLHCLAIIPSPQGERLGITHKGIGVVEHYLMARRLMTRNIYHGQKKLAIEQYLVELLAALSESLETYPAFRPINNTPLGLFLVAANAFNRAVKATPHKRIQLRDEFIATHYSIYKELCDYDVFAIIKQLSQLEDKHPSVQIAKRLQYRVMPSMLPLDYTDLPRIEDELNTFKVQHRDDYQDWQLRLIETPHQAYSGEADPILVRNQQGDIRPISDYSIMIDALSDKLEHIAFLAIDKSIADDKAIQHFILHLQKLTVTEKEKL